MFQKVFRRLPTAHQQFIAFCAVGVVGLVVDTASLSLLRRVFGLDLYTARIISELAIAMTVTWILNRTFTFRGSRDQPLWQEYLRFAAVNAVGNLANFGVYSALVGGVAIFGRVPELAIIIGTGVGVTFNFTGSKYLVFRRA